MIVVSYLYVEFGAGIIMYGAYCGSQLQTR
jgi:hypothetical protein